MNDPTKAADTAAIGSWLLWLSSYALQWIPILQALSLIVAIIAGGCAAYYHLTRANK